MAKRKAQFSAEFDGKVFHSELACTHAQGDSLKESTAEQIRADLKTKGKGKILAAYAELFELYGKRARVSGSKEFTPSTPWDSFNTQVQAISKKAGTPIKSEQDKKSGKFKIVSNEGSIGKTSPRKESKAGNKTMKGQTMPITLVDVRAKYASLCESMTMDQKVAELETLARAMGIRTETAEVQPIKPELAGDELAKAQKAMDRANARARVARRKAASK